MLDELDRLTDEAIEEKVGAIKSEVSELLDRYAALTRKSISQGDTIDIPTEAELYEVQNRIGMVSSGLAVIFMTEARNGEQHLIDHQFQASTLAERKGVARVEALKFIERLVSKVNTKVAQVLGLPLTLPKPPTDKGMN